ncbi:guanine deaminase [Plasticicumulans lactativorans]|uniref:Guanine deaminase n=1 Tax=Plasticicumulans lactativorans TaxID=1133106 RepID=A0A4R2L7F8_9GAMM|nr:guanine deaminase [Plasticicumulans lactativorans]TCO81908.1 guanine deaminase [Plasticicumulans lactativorans]
MHETSSRPVALRGRILHCLRDPGDGGDAGALEGFDDGLLLIEHGRVARLGPAAELLPGLPAHIEVHDHRGRLIVPGFVDTHIHFPQIDVIASYGEQLLEWLERYVFPAERRFEDLAHGQAMAPLFLDQLLRNGTTTALALCTVHPQSVDALLAAAQQRGMRLIAGKVLMDRHCPEFLRDDPERAYRESKALIERWHGVDRLAYAITPRFAPTSTEAQLEAAGRLAREHPDVYVQTHVAENRKEVAWVASLFPWARSYLDVYDHYGLLRERAIYAHCVWLDAVDRARLAASGAAAAFCPTSNLFLGSGLYDLAAMDAAGACSSLATDVGAGTSYSMLRTLAEAYKVLQLQGQRLTPARALYLATLAGARALGLAGRVGNFEPGREADAVVLDSAGTALTARRAAVVRDHDVLEEWFALFTLGDDRNVAATYLQGAAAWERGSA